MEKLWLLLGVIVIVAVFSMLDARRIKLHRHRNEAGHCALCDSKLVSFRVREARLRYTETGPSAIIKICLSCFNRRQKRRRIFWGTLIAVLVTLFLIGRYSATVSM